MSQTPKSNKKLSKKTKITLYKFKKGVKNKRTPKPPHSILNSNPITTVNSHPISTITENTSLSNIDYFSPHTNNDSDEELDVDSANLLNKVKNIDKSTSNTKNKKNDKPTSNTNKCCNIQ